MSNPISIPFNSSGKIAAWVVALASIVGAYFGGSEGLVCTAEPPVVQESD